MITGRECCSFFGCSRLRAQKINFCIQILSVFKAKQVDFYARRALDFEGSLGSPEVPMNSVMEEAQIARERRLRSLLLSSLDGDARSYDLFMVALTLHLRGFLWRRFIHQNSAEIEDLLQEILLAVHKARHSYRLEQPLTAWVAGIAKYKVADHFRAVARHQCMRRPWPAEEEFLAYDDNERLHAIHDLSLLLSQLPDRQRLPIIHVKLEGLSVIEAARRTGLSCSAVKIGIHRGLKALVAIYRLPGIKNSKEILS